MTLVKFIEKTSQQPIWVNPEFVIEVHSDDDRTGATTIWMMPTIEHYWEVEGTVESAVSRLTGRPIADVERERDGTPVTVTAGWPTKDGATV